MLHLTCSAAGRRFALKASSVERVILGGILEQLPHQQAGMVGVLIAGDEGIPVYDLALLLGAQCCDDLVGTRIILLRSGLSGLLGVRVESCTSLCTNLTPIRGDGVSEELLMDPDSRVYALLDLAKLVPTRFSAAMEGGANE